MLLTRTAQLHMDILFLREFLLKSLWRKLSLDKNHLELSQGDPEVDTSLLETEHDCKL